MLTIYEAPNVFPHQPLLIEICFRAAGEVFFVSPCHGEPEIEIRESEPNPFDKLNEALFERIHQVLTHSADWEAKSTMPAKAPVRKIGF